MTVRQWCSRRLVVGVTFAVVSAALGYSLGTWESGRQGKANEGREPPPSAVLWLGESAYVQVVVTREGVPCWRIVVNEEGLTRGEAWLKWKGKCEENGYIAPGATSGEHFQLAMVREKERGRIQLVCLPNERGTIVAMELTLGYVMDEDYWQSSEEFQRQLGKVAVGQSVYDVLLSAGLPHTVAGTESDRLYYSYRGGGNDGEEGVLYYYVMTTKAGRIVEVMGDEGGWDVID